VDGHLVERARAHEDALTGGLAVRQDDPTDDPVARLEHDDLLVPRGEVDRLLVDREAGRVGHQRGGSESGLAGQIPSQRAGSVRRADRSPQVRRAQEQRRVFDRIATLVDDTDVELRHLRRRVRRDRKLHARLPRPELRVLVVFVRHLERGRRCEASAHPSLRRRVGGRGTPRTVESPAENEEQATSDQDAPRRLLALHGLTPRIRTERRITCGKRGGRARCGVRGGRVTDPEAVPSDVPTSGVAVRSPRSDRRASFPDRASVTSPGHRDGRQDFPGPCSPSPCRARGSPSRRLRTMPYRSVRCYSLSTAESREFGGTRPSSLALNLNVGRPEILPLFGPEKTQGSCHGMDV